MIFTELEEDLKAGSWGFAGLWRCEVLTKGTRDASVLGEGWNVNRASLG